MSELRKDPVSRRWVIFSPERAYRPSDFKEKKKIKENKANCPFCEGKEKESGNEIFVDEKINDREPNSPGWWVRVLENKYPSLRDVEKLEKKGVGLYDRMNGMGRHEIIVETPKHLICLSDLHVNEVEKVIRAYHDRYLDIKKDQDIKYILIFKNYGKEAGASLEHSHSQLIATPVVPKKVETELRGAKSYYQFRDRCVFCDIISQELVDKDRMVEENEYFIAFVFYAGRFPYETWIAPKVHSANFENINRKERRAFAAILKNTISRIKIALNDPDYNFVIHTAPVSGEGEKYYHWHVEIMPKLTKVAGFEWGTGYYINPLIPEKAAMVLRKVDLPCGDENENI